MFFIGSADSRLWRALHLPPAFKVNLKSDQIAGQAVARLVSDTGLERAPGAKRIHGLLGDLNRSTEHFILNLESAAARRHLNADYSVMRTMNKVRIS